VLTRQKLNPKHAKARGFLDRNKTTRTAFLRFVPGAWIEIPIKTGFSWFTENRSIKFEILKNLRNFEIKISKKTSLHLKNFGENGI
jgi:hypothetical protein